MTEFWICFRGDVTDEQIRGLQGAGLATDDLRRVSGGFGLPIRWETLRTCVRVVAADESEARNMVAEALGVEPADLVRLTASIFE